MAFFLFVVGAIAGLLGVAILVMLPAGQLAGWALVLLAGVLVSGATVADAVHRLRRALERAGGA